MILGEAGLGIKQIDVQPPCMKRRCAFVRSEMRMPRIISSGCFPGAEGAASTCLSGEGGPAQRADAKAERVGIRARVGTRRINHIGNSFEERSC